VASWFKGGHLNAFESSLPSEMRREIERDSITPAHESVKAQMFVCRGCYKTTAF